MTNPLSKIIEESERIFTSKSCADVYGQMAEETAIQLMLSSQRSLLEKVGEWATEMKIDECSVAKPGEGICEHCRGYNLAISNLKSFLSEALQR
jgi:hypothetical protein